VITKALHLRDCTAPCYKAPSVGALRDGNVLPFVGLSPETRTFRAPAHWPSSAGGRSSCEQSDGILLDNQPVPDILMLAGAYRIGHSGSTGLLAEPFSQSRDVFLIISLPFSDTI